jgi:ribosomal protein L18E
MRYLFSFFLILVMSLISFGQTQLILNGDFSAAASAWIRDGDFYYGTTFSNCPCGTPPCYGYAYLSAPNGAGATNLDGYIQQTVTLPYDCSSATLSFCYNSSSLTTPTPNNYFYAYILKPSSSLVEQVPNQTVTGNAAGAITTNVSGTTINYNLTNSNFLQAGSQLTIYFRALTNTSTNTDYNTTMRLDNVSFTAYPATRVISLSGNMNFGNVSVGSSSQQTLTISNTGNSSLTVSQINLPLGFSSNFPGVISAGSSQNVTVTFAPTTATSYSGTITVLSNATSGTNTISCSGTGTAAPIIIIGVSGNLAYGNWTVGSTSSLQTLTIANSGNATLSVTGITYPAGFTGSYSGNIAAGSSVNVAVYFSPTAATSYWGTVTVNSNATSGTNTISCSGTGINPVPTVSSFAPTSAASGATVTITGTSFIGTTAVSFGGTAATSFTVVYATSITAVVASGTSGSVSVTTPGGIGTLAGFTFISAPTVSSFNPTSGVVGTTVTITGTNFSTTAANNIVKFNGTTATISGTPTATSISTTVPSGATTGTITVTVGSLTATSSTNFTVTTVTSPTISSFNPTSGLVGATVTITGTNFSTTAANNIVNFNGTTATISGTPTATSIVTTVPSGATTGAITVTVGGLTATSSTNFTVASLTSPTIAIFTPTSGLVGATVTITGTNFSTTAANNIVRFNGTTATISGTPTATSISTTVPSGATTGTITVTVGSLTATSSTNFTVTTATSPTIASFNPTSGVVGTTVTITGTNFSTTAANNIVNFNGTTATISGTPTATSIVTTVPSGATTGTIAVTVGGLTATSSTNFTVPDLLAPTLIAFSPLDNATGVPANSNLVLTFSETVQKGTGNIIIKENGATTQTISVTNVSITVSGSTVTINPSDFSNGAAVNVEIALGAIMDMANNNNAGIANATTWNFTVATDATPPVITNGTPTTISQGAALTITATITDSDTPITAASVEFRSIAVGSSNAATIRPLAASTNTYTATIAAAEIGELGIEYKLSATSAGGTSTTGTTFKTVSINHTLFKFWKWPGQLPDRFRAATTYGQHHEQCVR